MIVIARGYGQLGNRLFLYAHLIAAAREYGVGLANPCFAEYAHLFCATEHDLWCRYPRIEPTEENRQRPPSLRRRMLLAKAVHATARACAAMRLTRFPFSLYRVKGEQLCDVGSEPFATDAQRDRHLLALGWLFRSERLFAKHADAVREHFEITPAHRDNVNRCITALRSDADVIVGVHVRHGDYATFMGGQFFFSVAEYAEAMHRVAEQLSGRRVAFLVCSNVDLKREEFGGLNVHFGPGHLIEDMYAMAEADLLMGPPSTYTGWASFYGGVPLLAMRKGEPIQVPATLIRSAA